MSASASVVSGETTTTTARASHIRVPAERDPLSSSTTAAAPAAAPLPASSTLSAPPHWGVSLHPSVFRVEATGRDILYNLHRNGTLRYYYHLLQATSTSSIGLADVPVSALPSRSSAPSLRDSFTEEARAATLQPALPDPALTHRMVQRCLRLSIPQIVSFRYSVHAAHHVPNNAGASTQTHGAAGGGSGGADPAASASLRADRAAAASSSSTTSRRALSTDQLVGQMRSSRLNSIEALLPNHSPFSPISIQRTQFPLSHEEEARRDATVRELISEPLCRQVAVSLEKQLHESRVSQRHQGRLFAFRAADPVREPASVYSGFALDLVVGAGEVSGLYHSPLISGMEVAIASMTVGETAGFFVNAPQTFAFSAPDLDLAVPSTSTSARVAASASAASHAEARFNETVPTLVARGADRVLYYEIHLTRRAPAIQAFPPCRGLTLFTVPPMSIQRIRRELQQRVLRQTVEDHNHQAHAMRRLRDHDQESLQRLQAAARCNPYSFFLFTNLTRVGHELPVATFCAVRPDVYTTQLEADTAAATGPLDKEEQELKRLHAWHLGEAETAIQAALLDRPADTTAAANRAFAMAVSMTMGSTTLFDITHTGHDADDMSSSSASRTGGGGGSTTATATAAHACTNATFSSSSHTTQSSHTNLTKSQSTSFLRGPGSPEESQTRAAGQGSPTPPAVTHVPPPSSLTPGVSSTLSSLGLSPGPEGADLETHGLLTHTLEAAMINFGLSRTAAALRDAVSSALSAPGTPTAVPSLPMGHAGATLAPPLSCESHPLSSGTCGRPSSPPPRSVSSPTTSASTVGVVSAGESHRSPQRVLAGEYERWLTEACHHLDTRFLPCPRGAALVQLRLSRYEPLTEQFYDLLQAPPPHAADDGRTGAAPLDAPADAHATTEEPPLPPTGTMITPVCSLAIPCWLSLALTQQLHRAAAADPARLTESTAASVLSLTPPSERDFCVSSVRVQAPIGLPMDQSDEEAFMIHFFQQLRTHTSASFEDCRSHLMEQLGELANCSSTGGGAGGVTEARRGDSQERTGEKFVKLPMRGAPDTAHTTPATTTAPTPQTQAQTQAHGSEVVLAAYPWEERTAAAPPTPSRSAPEASTGSVHGPAGAAPVGSAAGLQATSAALHTPASVPTAEEQYHLESRIVSASPALRKRHFFFLNPKTSLAQVRTLLSRVCTLLHIYDARNPYRRGATRVWRSSSLASSTTSRVSVRQTSHHGVLNDDGGEEAVARQYSSPLAGSGPGASASATGSPHVWQSGSSGHGADVAPNPHKHGRPPPPHPALAGWAPLELQCAKLTSRLDKIRDIPEHETMVDQLLLGPTVCAQTLQDLLTAPASREDLTTTATATAAAEDAGAAAGASVPEAAPMRTWANVLDCATFFSVDECGRLLPEQREKAVLRRCLFKVFELAYLAIVLLTFGTEESQLRPSSFLAQGGYGPYFAKSTTTPVTTTDWSELSVRLDDTTDVAAAIRGCVAMAAARDSTRLASNKSSTADLLAASMAASTCLTTPQAAQRTPSDNSKRRRYQYLAECYQYVALTFWELLVPYLLTPSVMLQREEPEDAEDPSLRPISYTSSTTRKAPIANMLAACGSDAVTYALLYDPHETSLWSLRARFHTQQGLYEEAQRDLDVAKHLTSAEKTEQTRLMRRKRQAESFMATTPTSASPTPTRATTTTTTTAVPSTVTPLLQEEAVLGILEDRLVQLEEQEEQLKVLRAASSRERSTSPQAA